MRQKATVAVSSGTFFFRRHFACRISCMSTLRQIISSYSSTLLGNEKRVTCSVRKKNEREGVRFTEKEIEKVIDEGTQYFGAVDFNDRFRQGYLNWEQAWPTKRI